MKPSGNITIMQAIASRHSVRAYQTTPLDGEELATLLDCMSLLNMDSGLSMQLCLDEPKAFSGLMAKYGRFRNACNYISLVGKAGNALAEACGYYGEALVLKAQQLGFDTCWVGGTFSRKNTAAIVKESQKLHAVIAIGYGETNGKPHKSKPMEKLCSWDGDMPAWFRSGMEAAMLAPSAMNRQRFHFRLSGSFVHATGNGTDLGIAKYHFEQGAAHAGNPIGDGWGWC